MMSLDEMSLRLCPQCPLPDCLGTSHMGCLINIERRQKKESAPKRQQSRANTSAVVATIREGSARHATTGK